MRHRLLLVWSLGFAAGIGAQMAGRDWLGLWAGLGALGLILSIGAGRRWGWATAGILLAGLGTGAVRLAVAQTVPVSDVSRWAGQVAPVMLTGTVASDPQTQRGGRVALIIRAQTIEQYGKTEAATGDCYVTLTTGALGHHTPPDYGDRVTLGGRLDIPPTATNPGAFSWRDYLARRGVWCELRVKRPGAIGHDGGSTLNPFLRLAWTIRRHILLGIRAALPATQAAVLSGILLGQRTELPPDLMADFVHTGTVHILASAGLHVGVVAFWMVWLCERLTVPRKASALLTVGTLWLYALMAGGRPSVTRAVIMATVYFGAVLFEREPDAPTALAAAALVILFEQPTALVEAGFQLSFLTVMTLMLAMPVWQALWRPRLEKRVTQPFVRKALWGIIEMGGLSLFAQLGSLPIVASDYNEASLCGFFANALVVPTLFLLIPLGLTGAALWGLCPAVGGALLHLTGLGLGYVTAVVQFFGEGSWAYRAVLTPSPWLILSYYALVFGVALHLSQTATVRQLNHEDVPLP
jgi:competence protein ComEC